MNKHTDFSLLGPFIPWTVHSLELVPGTLGLSCRGPFVHLSAGRQKVQRRNSVTNRSVCLWQRPCTAAIHKQ